MRIDPEGIEEIVDLLMDKRTPIRTLAGLRDFGEACIRVALTATEDMVCPGCSLDLHEHPPVTKAQHDAIERVNTIGRESAERYKRERGAKP